MKILITGCAGFIGWKVTEFALRDGHTVVGVDNLNDAYDVRLKEWRLRHLMAKSSNFSFHKLDIASKPDLVGLLEEEMAKEPFDAVISLAARAGVRQSVEEPWTYYEANVIGTLNLLELCRRHGVKKFVLASTSSLYGAHNPRPFHEDANTDSPLSPYAASKKAAEVLAYTYHYLYDIDITVLRYFTVYGPAGRPDMSIFRFIRWVAEGEPVIVYGDGSQERDFTYVGDIARGTLAALKPTGYEIVNLGSDRPTALKQVLELIEGLIGKKVEMIYKPAHPADVSATWADISKAGQLLNWAPETALEDGLREAVNWYFENREWAKEVRLS